MTRRSNCLDRPERTGPHRVKQNDGLLCALAIAPGLGRDGRYRFTPSNICVPVRKFLSRVR